MSNVEQDIVVPIKSILKEMKVNIEISGYKGWLVRLFIAKYFVRFGCWIAGLSIKIEDSND